MRLQDLKNEKYRPCFSGHETFPLRYGWLQKAYHAVSNASSPKEAVHVFRDPESIALFGVGRNMIAAIRYWAIGTGILDETKEGIETTWLGDMLFSEDGIDLYLEEDASLWLLHWHLAARPRLTSAYWLFNEYRGGGFVRQDIVTSLLSLSQECAWSRVAATTVDRDLQCLLRTYIGGRGSSEARDSILAELGLIRPIDKHRAHLSRGRKLSLPDAVFLYCLIEFWENFASEQNTMSFENTAYAPGSPGRVFLLDEEDIVGRLERLEDVSKGALVWSETAGLRQIIRSNRRSIQLERNALYDELVNTCIQVAT
ncbi:DUF4007 family protein [Halothiobacillus sp.]|uniref:DUF4007 family protein n=1 Tax=Halothiobacillus sp. TaxID=1891311 RepID=UPI00261F3727|nr:DUF4007 family protein [Halothiobacillus sp.]MDD4965391.1 DUF4007 family protein [Halothiobacillus sp.]